MKSEIETAVRNQKKVEILQSRITSTDLNQIAGTFATETDTARAISFSSGFIPGIGQEPKVLATAFQLEQNQVSAPIGGNNGVFVVKVLNKTSTPAPGNLSVIKRSNAQQVSSQLQNSLMPALKEEASVKDYRSKFY